MNTQAYQAPFPDIATVPSELSFDDSWDGEAVSNLIRSKSDAGVAPALLFLGRKEASLLKQHLAEIWGDESVATLHGTYYKGLKVVTIDCESFLTTGGHKAIRKHFRQARHDWTTEAIWQLRL